MKMKHQSFLFFLILPHFLIASRPTLGHFWCNSLTDPIILTTQASLMNRSYDLTRFIKRETIRTGQEPITTHQELTRTSAGTQLE